MLLTANSAQVILVVLGAVFAVLACHTILGLFRSAAR
jgi:hypothetical protein